MNQGSGMMPHIFIQLSEFSLDINLGLCMYILVLIIVYRKYSFYMVRACKADRLPKHVAFAHKIIDGFTLLLIVLNLVLSISVGND
jgi:hypothetical protein